MSLFGASLVLPVEHRSILNRIELLLVPAETLLVGYVGVRAYRGMRDWTPADQRRDLVERLHSMLRPVAPHPAVAGAAGHEIATLYYAFLSWRSKPDVVAGELAFSYHRKKGYGGVLVMAALVVAPILLTPEGLHIRIGLLWSVRIPYTQIAHLSSAGRNPAQRSGIDDLHAVAIGTPQLVLDLREPLDVHGPYDHTKHGVDKIGIAIDERENFAAELESRPNTAG